MYFGKPLIATDTRGPRELIENNKNGFLVPVGDYKYLAKCIKRISSDSHSMRLAEKYSKKKIKNYYMKNVLSEINEYY